MSDFSSNTLRRIRKAYDDLFDKQRSLNSYPYVKIVRGGSLTVTEAPEYGIKAQYADVSLTNVPCDVGEVSMDEAAKSNGLMLLGDRRFTLKQPAFIDEQFVYSELFGIIPTVSANSSIKLNSVTIYPCAETETWTLQFSSNSAFTVTNDAGVGEGSGSIGQVFNPISGRIQIAANAWSGIPIAGDKFEIKTRQSDWDIYHVEPDEVCDIYDVLARRVGQVSA